MDKEINEPVIEQEVGESEAFVDDSHDEELVIQIGDEEPEEQPESAPDWVKDLRKANREKEKRIKELEAKLQAPVVEIKKPTREEHDYDDDAYEEALLKWSAGQREVQDRQRREQEQAEASQQAFETKRQAYEEAKTKLNVLNYEEAEAFVTESFSELQQGIAIQGSDNPAVLVYALGKNPKKAKELAAITDPILFAFALAKLETQVKTTKRMPTVGPEGSVRSDAPSSGGTAKLDKLREEAAKTGDFSKVAAFKRAMRK